MKKNILYAMLIFTIAFSIRVLVIQNYEQSIGCDQAEYHNLAANIVNNGSYSLYPISEGSTFYREPGHPFFLAGSYYIWKLLGNEIELISSEEHKTHQLSHFYPEIRFAKYFKAFISSISCIFFFFLLRLELENKKALVIAIIFSICYNVVIYDLNLMRESTQIVFTIISSYYFAKFLLDRKFWNFIVFSILVAILVLLLKTALIAPVFVFVFILIKWKDAKKALVFSVLTGIIIAMISLPWLTRTYYSYPNTKLILTSWGTTLTTDKMKYMRESDNYKELTKKEHPLGTTHWELWPQGLKETYDKTLNNVYKKKTDIISEDIKSIDKMFYIKNSFKNFYKGIKQLIYNPPKIIPNKLVQTNRFVGLLFAIAFMVGVLKCYKKYYFLFIGSIMYFIVIVIVSLLQIGIMNKRLIAPTLPMFIFFSIMGFIKIYELLKGKFFLSKLDNFHQQNKGG